MSTSFRDNLQDGMIYRKQAKLPNVNLVITAVIICTLASILLAMFGIPPHKPDEYHFVNESGAITALSAIYLAMASSFSIGTLVVNVRIKNPHTWLWVVMALGFAILALDELLQFHERIGNRIGQYVNSGIFRNWNDVIVILYGVIAIPIMTLFLPEIIRHRLLLELFIVAIVFYGIHTLIDSTQEPRTTMSAIFEESAKLFCVLFLALGAFVAFLGSLWNTGSLDERDTMHHTTISSRARSGRQP